MATLFPILIEVEQSAVGKVLILLKGYPGIAKLHLDLDNVGKKPGKRVNGDDDPGHHPRTKKNPDAPAGKAIIINELISGPKNLDHLREKFKENGLSSGNVSTALYELQKKGVTESAGVGLHQLTERAMAEMKAQQSAQAPQLSPPEKSKRKFGESREFVLTAIGNGKTRSEIVASKPQHMTERTIDGALTRLKKDKLIAPTDEPGQFKLVPAKAARKSQT